MPNAKTLTRRRLLQRGAGAVVGACWVPTIIPRRVLASSEGPGANDRIAVGAIGVGRQGGALLGNVLRKKDARVVALADVNLPRAQQQVKKVQEKTDDGGAGSPAAYQDYRELLDREDIDAIITATNDHWRALVCIRACQAGKDIYAEKPMTLTIREGRLMVQAVRKYGRVFQTGSHQRSMAANRLGCELVRNGRVGEIQKVIGHNYPSPWEGALPSQPVPTGIDWDMWCGPTEPVSYHANLYAPRDNPGWLSFRPYSGGEMTGWGSHGLDQVQWALGMDETGPVEIWTDGEAFQPPTYTAPESRKRGDTACSVPKVFFRYANGIELELGRGNPGGAIFLGEDGKLEIFRGRVTSNPEEIAAEPLTDADVRLYASNDHMQNWLDSIKSRERPVADVETGHRSATVCHLGNIARWANRRLRWDPVNEVFVGDEEANRYLDRPRRKPYELPETI